MPESEKGQKFVVVITKLILSFKKTVSLNCEKIEVAEVGSETGSQDMISEM